MDTATQRESSELGGRGVDRLRTGPARNLEGSSTSRKSETQGQSWGEARALVWALAHVQTHMPSWILDDIQLPCLAHGHLESILAVLGTVQALDKHYSC